MLTKLTFWHCSGHHFRHLVPMLVTMWGLFFIAAPISFALRAYAGDRRFSLAGLRDAYFPREFWTGRSAKFDLIIWVVNQAFYSFPFRVAGPAVLAALVAAALSQHMPHHHVHQAGFAMLICCSLLLFLLSDFVNYGTHSIYHSVPILWEFHKVHHSATFLSPFTGDRRHPFCIYFDAAIDTVMIGSAAGIMEILLNFNLAELFLVTAVIKKLGYLVALDSLKHSHFPVSLGKFEAVISSPRMHQIHHSSKDQHLGKNLGDVLCIWDRLFGSCYVPVANEHKVLGLDALAAGECASLRGIYIEPILKAGGLIKFRLQGFGGKTPRSADPYHGRATGPLATSRETV